MNMEWQRKKPLLPGQYSYSSPQWQRVRKLALERDNYLCQSCLRKQPSRITPATEVHHLKQRADGGLDTLDNLESICHHCHVKETLAERNATYVARGSNAQGKPTDPEHPWNAQMRTHEDAAYPSYLRPASCWLTIVFGPPAAGKTKYVQDNRQEHDEVIDLNCIITEITNTATRTAFNSTLLDKALRIRNQRLLALATKSNEHRAWFITTGKGKSRRDWWTRKLQPIATHVVVEPAHICIARIESDPLRAQRADEQVIAVRDWFAAEHVGQRAA